MTMVMSSAVFSGGNFTSSVALVPNDVDIGSFHSTAVSVDGLGGPTYLVGGDKFETREATVFCRQELDDFAATGKPLNKPSDFGIVMRN